MAKASGYAGEGEASGSAMTGGGGGGGGGGGFELNSVTPSAVKNTIGVTAGGITGSNFFPRRSFFGLEPNMIALGVSAAALVVVMILLRRRSS